MPLKIKIINIAGTRPNFIKIAPLLAEQKKYPELIQPILVHTGQHYDFEMSRIFFQDLRIPKPDYNLEVGSGSHAWQTAKIMEKLEKVLLKENPNLVIVVGDVNSTLAGALTAAKLNIPVAHIEAGLRSFDMSMPEEINRRLTDHISDYLFVTELSGVKNLLNEGIERKKIFFVGNVMIDTLIKSKIKSKKSKILKRLRLESKNYALLTLHRSENVDNSKVLKQLFEGIGEIQKKIKIVFPVHPRTRKQLPDIKIEQYYNNILFTEPFGYLDFLSLESEAKFVLTDSGGIQEETTFLQIPCLTLRENTERPVTIERGTNILCGRDKEKIIREANKIIAGKQKIGKIPKYWDGKSAKKIIKIIKQIYL
jgi:UDP-N-acetylglucosamine 2-epimerase (non-hydrolysing)